MVTSQQIGEYLKRVPPLPEALSGALKSLEEGELASAAKAASSDPALIHYLKQVVNSAAYGFKQELKDPMQIFSALGTERAKQLLYAYMVHSVAPQKWGYFSLDKEGFRQFQVSLMQKWEQIVSAEKIEEKYMSAAALMSAGLIVADAIFADHASDVALIRESGDLDLDTILERVSRLSFEQLVRAIAKKWEVDDDIIRLVSLSFGKTDCSGSESLCRPARLLHLLLFYELSRPVMLDAGANAFISFNPEFSMPVLERFEEIVGVA
ncbi:HDOD domain-containing protein [Hydrogenimonas sp.]